MVVYALLGRTALGWHLTDVTKLLHSPYLMFYPWLVPQLFSVGVVREVKCIINLSDHLFGQAKTYMKFTFIMFHV